MPDEEHVPEEIIRYEEGTKDKIDSLMEYLIPLPCLDYQEVAGNCRAFECLSIDGKDPLCRTRRLLAEQLVSAIRINKYDPLHPGYSKLPPEVKTLIAKAAALRHGEPFPPPWMNRKGEE